MRYGKTIGTGEAISVLKAENAELLDRIERLEEMMRLMKIAALLPDWWGKDMPVTEKAIGLNYVAGLIEGKRA